MKRRTFEVSLPCPRYRLRAGMLQVMRVAAQGGDLSTAAMAAGFDGSAAAG